MYRLLSTSLFRKMGVGAFCVLLALTSLIAQEGNTRLKLMHYNLLRFGNECTPVSINQKSDWLGTILNFYQPDILTVNELVPEAAFEALIEAATQSYNPAMKAAGFTNEAESEIVNDLFYNSDKLGLAYIEILPGAFRDINVYTLSVVGEDSLFLHCIVAHFKAGRDAEDRELRMEEAETIINWIRDAQPRGAVLLMGDLNFDNAGEAAWQLLINEANSEHFVDPLGLTDDWNGPDFAEVHTQSTRTELPDCGVNGGLDDRFDFFLFGPGFNEQGFIYATDSYQALGNAGNSFNVALGCTGEGVPIVICNTLRQMSDHLPIVMEVDASISLVSAEDGLLEAGYRVPNPFSETLVVNAPSSGEEKPQRMELLNFEGKRMILENHPESSGAYAFDTESLAPGIYWLQVYLQNGQVRGKRVVKY